MGLQQCLFIYWYERSCCGQLPFLHPALSWTLGPHTWKAQFVQATEFKIILELRKGSFSPGVHLFTPSMPEKPVGEINLPRRKNPNLWYPWAMKPRSTWSLLAQMILTGMSAWTKGWWVFHWHGREEMDQIHQWNQLKKNRNSNKQTNMARKLKGKEMKGRVGACHGINTKISDGTEKWCFQVWISGISWDGQACQRGDSADTKLKAELTKASRKASLGIAPTLWVRADKAGAAPRRAEGRKLGNSSWANAREKLAAQHSPWRLYTEGGIFLPHLSFLQDNSSFGKLQPPHYLQLWYFSHPLCQLHLFELCTNRNNASLLQCPRKGSVTQQGEL